MDSEKRLIVAIALSVLILLGFSSLFPRRQPPPEPPVPAESPAIETPAERQPAAPPETAANAAPAAAPETEAAVSAETEEQFRVENDLFEAVFTNRGGRALTWTLKLHTTADGTPLQVFPQYEQRTVLPLGIELDDPTLTGEINDALYHVEREPLATSSEQPGGDRLTFTWSDGRGIVVRKSFEIHTGSYLVDVRIDVTDRGRRLPSRLNVGPGFAAQEPSSTHSNYYYESQLAVDAGGQVTRRKRKKLDDGGAVDGQIFWAGLEDQYFTSLILPNAQPSRVEWTTPELTALPIDAEAETKELTPQPTPVVSVSVGETGAQLYVGPKQYHLLKSIGGARQLQKAVWFATQDWLRVIVKYLFLGLTWLHDHVTQNWGLAIILATVMLRLVLFPINQYSMVNMKKTQLQMQKLQPKIKAIRNKYKKAKDAQSKQNMNKEMMELYRREGVNPMGGVSGCLPMLAQFPILIGFYNMLTVAVELRGAPFFGWITDLSDKDPKYILPILMAIAMFAQQKLAMSKIKDPQQLKQQQMMLFMPVVFGIICLQMPSGLVLYWFVNNLLGMGQQWLVNRHAGRLEAAAQKA